MQNDEIKEILDKWKDKDDTIKVNLSLDEIRQLEDYITNLQQENERLKEIIENLTTMTVCGDRKQIKNTAQYKLEIYKSRCEKAIEYNNQIIKDTKDFYRPTTDIIYSGDCLIDIAKNNINILQNGSDSQ